MTDSSSLKERYCGIFLLTVMDGGVNMQLEFEIL
jgi:hypothetical protein